MHDRNNSRPQEGRAKSLLNDLLSSMAGRPQEQAMFTALFVDGKPSAAVRKDLNLSEQEYQEQHLAMMRRFRIAKEVSA
ncbi:hypothetical protein [Cupriavidus sp. CP313]